MQDARKTFSIMTKMHSSGLVLITILLSAAQLIQAVSLTTSPLFNFTRQGSETSLAVSDDGSSEAISMSTPFVFYESKQTTIFVSLLSMHSHL